MPKDSINPTHFVFDKDFKTKYQTEDFQYETIIKQGNFWDKIVHFIRKFLSMFSNSGNTISSKTAENTLLVIFAIIIGFAVYIFVKLYLKNKKNLVLFQPSETVIDFDNIEKHIHQVDFESLIESYKQQDIRILTRYYFLWYLKLLCDRNFFKWDIEKTNLDYLSEIKDLIKREEFENLSFLYENIWYGEFNIPTNTTETIIQQFETAIQKLKI